jgi:peptide/nickel transport system substrate-binding protein
MKRLIAVAVLVAGLSGGLGHHAAAQDEVTLTVGLVQDMSSPNVAVGYLVPEFDVWNLQYATLTDKAADDFATVPGLAESWEGSDDGLTYTYKLRDGLKWSDGEPLTADDIAYTINRSRDEQWANHFSTTGNLDATAIDARTVQITSSVPDPKLPTMDVYIVPKHIYESIDAEALLEYDALDGVASGPYSLESWRSGQDWTMVKNPNWWGRDNGIDRIVYRVFTNPDAMVAALQQGEIDFAHDIPYPSIDLLREEEGIEVVDGQQGGFTELALNGGQGGIGDGHPALQDIDVRHAIYYAIDRDVLFDRVALGLGGKGTTLSPSADPSWMPDLGDENYTYDPDKAKQILDDAGYVDTDGDGIREMPDGSRPLEFRYAERSESSIAAPIREFVTGWLRDIGISTVVSVMDDTQLYDVQVAGNYDMFSWGWTPYVDPDPQLSYFTCDEITTDVNDPGSNDANWCSAEYDELYQQQKVELDSDKRHEIVHEMLELFNRESTYLVLLQDADTQAYRTDRFEGWLQQPAGDGPVLFTNTSPSYVNLSVIGGGDDDGGGVNVALIVGIAVAAVALIGLGAFVITRRSSDENRE